MYKLLLFIILFSYSSVLWAQSDVKAARVKAEVDSINQLLDNAVVNKEEVLLQKHYASHFVFTHGTGQVDSKASWIKYVLEPETKFISRKHDSTHVELHHRIAIISGTLMVRKPATPKENVYGLRYVRVYVHQNKRWQLISHRTVLEWHL